MATVTVTGEIEFEYDSQNFDGELGDELDAERFRDTAMNTLIDNPEILYESLTVESDEL